ncbi:MAG: WYL domain-containing protein [Saprospiraceae bacterium]|nr:WYL domain-containing protein [Saprospiraceae bacterium]
MLADRFQVSIDTIKGDLNIFRDAGLMVSFDTQYRYFLEEEKPYLRLSELLHFSEEDQFILWQAIDQVSPHSIQGARLKRKLASLYDYHRLGHAYLRKPYLSKIDLLLQAKEEKRQVILKGYKSGNSNEVRDRKVEPFHPSPPDDILHAYDLDKGALRHYRISRILRVKLLDQGWENEGKHQILLTDPFRIVDNKQVMVHLRLKVGAYNELIERFPLTKAYIEEEEMDIYDFQCMVNHKFIGLTNFILGYHHQLVQVISPYSLLQHLQNEIGKLNFLMG